MRDLPLKSFYLLPSSKILFSLGSFLLVSATLFSQNVGIGTNSPLRTLSVAGTVVVDHDTTADGTLANPSLLFGKDALIGISSNRSVPGTSYRGLEFYTNSFRRMFISSSGNVGINVSNPQHKLHVSGDIYSNSDILASATVSGNAVRATNQLSAGIGNFNSGHRLHIIGTSYIDGSLQTSSSIFSEGPISSSSNGSFNGWLVAEGNIFANSTLRVANHSAIGGALDPNYRLRVYDGNARIGGDFHATGNAAIGGETDPGFRLRVWGGNSRFGGNVEVTGSLDVSSMNGKGVVTSNGPSSLRIGFNEKFINYLNIGSGLAVNVTVDIPDFEGDNDDVRVMVAQFVPDPLPQFSDWNGFTFHVHSVDPVANTAKIKVTNVWNAPLDIKGTIHIVTIAKN